MCPLAFVVTLSIAVKLPPNPGDVEEVLFVLLILLWLIVIVSPEPWLVVKLPPVLNLFLHLL